MARDVCNNYVMTTRKGLEVNNMDTVIFTVDDDGICHFYGQYPSRDCDAFDMAITRLENSNRQHGDCPQPVWAVFAAQQKLG